MTEATPQKIESKIIRHVSPVALIRAALSRARVLAVRLIGPPGAGKTQLIQETLKHLPNARRVAVIAVNPAAGRDAARLHGAAGLVEHIDAPIPTAATIWRVLSAHDLTKFDIVLIECAGGLSALPDLGQDASVAVFGVSGGDDKAMEYAALLDRVGAVVLTKIDLRPVVKFDSRVFRADVERINPGAVLHEVSSLSGAGMFSWLHWLNERHAAKRLRDEPRRKSSTRTSSGNSLQPGTESEDGKGQAESEYGCPPQTDLRGVRMARGWEAPAVAGGRTGVREALRLFVHLPRLTCIVAQFGSEPPCGYDNVIENFLRFAHERSQTPSGENEAPLRAYAADALALIERVAASPPKANSTNRG